MAQHADAAGDDLHDPKGITPTPLDAPKNEASSYQLRWDSDGAGGAYRDVLVARTTDGNLGFVLGNSAEVWPIEIVNAQIQVDEISAPGTPAAGKVAVYAKTDGKLYIKDDAGTETDLTGGGGASAYTRTAVASSPYTVLAEQEVIGVTWTTATTINLRAAATAGAGAWLIIKDESGDRTNVITIDGSGSETIDGSTTIQIAAAYGAVELYCDGSNWFVL